MSLPSRLGCSTITFQHLSLADALVEIAALGATEIDLGALPGVCDHVPFDLDDAAIARVVAAVTASGLRVRSVNGDIGDLNDPAADELARAQHLDRLLRLSAAIGADALVLPCGALDHAPITDERSDLDRVAYALATAADAAHLRGVELWIESLHFLRFSWSRERADALHARLDAAGARVGIVLDVAHVTAAGDSIAQTVADWQGRITHVHLRDAVRGDFSRRIGEGEVDFAAAFDALTEIGYSGGFSLEQPTRAYVDDATAVAGDDRRVELASIADRSLTRLRDAMAASLHQ
ncbi:sugar phosphate isomerase/epimerase [Agrococcus sp. ARC_14]|uniref:sugar phosphate isomerase/epimerase family protein n=1 Tax=Agrococcus sp. ARC_14 TaxID=2919927 RepID=UPI001F05870D|nr:sugar phosphate isomerase/epimerase [Agrococcus sp. ARC_14]MCH1881439.1 sugar phosphate isomerase/epimerase [Agrococcus sp. ARC_14]